MIDVWTIGHSNHPIAAFLDLLARHGITAVADVRSAPYSRFNPQYRRDALKASLEAAGIAYVYLGRELGGRSDDPAMLEEGRVRYDRLAGTDRFRAGLDRVLQGARRYRIALTCAEKEPLACHRTLLVSRRLAADGVGIGHILADGSVEPHEAAVDRLLRLHRPAGGDLLRPRDELVAEAYDRQAARVAHRKPREPR
jgi:uncharacterized protein (DUF488 family)